MRRWCVTPQHGIQELHRLSRTVCSFTSQRFFFILYLSNRPDSSVFFFKGSFMWLTMMTNLPDTNQGSLLFDLIPIQNGHCHFLTPHLHSSLSLNQHGCQGQKKGSIFTYNFKNNIQGEKKRTKYRGGYKKISLTMEWETLE